MHNVTFNQSPVSWQVPDLPGQQRQASDYYVIGLPDMAEEIVKSSKVCAMTNTGNSMYTPDKRFRGNRLEAYWEGDFIEIKPNLSIT